MRRFGLEIAGAGEGEARAWVVRLEGGYGELRFSWDAEARALVDRLRGPRPDAEAAERLGARLEAALAGPAWTRFADALAAGDFELTIRVTDPVLFRLPWELVRLEGGVRLGRIPGAVIRHARLGRKAATTPLPEGGHVVFAHASPTGAVPVAGHTRALADALRTAPPGFARAATVVADASRAQLRAALPDARVLHLLVHGARDPANPDVTALVLAQPDAREEPAFVRGEELAGLLAPFAAHLRLVVIAACGGSDAGSLDVTLGSVAEALHGAGIEAVVAARYPLAQAASVTFAREFYAALLGEWRSVEEAFAAARTRLADEAEGFDWASLQLFADAGTSRPIAIRPFRGLLVYEAEHRRLFFGRDAEREALRGRLIDAREGRRSRLQAVIGASGSGKSSLIRAGVLPDLPADWTLETLRPAQGPLAPPGPPPDGWRVLFVDQFEEVFAVEGDRQAYVDALHLLATAADSRTVVLLAMRADALGRCGTLRAGGVSLDRVLNDDAHRTWLYGLEAAQRLEVVEGPARRVGLTLEAGLAEALAAELGEEPGALPLVAHALDQVWARRSGDTLTHAALREIGGVRGAITRTADEVVAAMTPAQAAHARRLLVALVDLGEQGGRDTRGRVALDQVSPPDPAAFDGALRALSDARLIVTGEADGRPYADLAHEALIRSWATLGRWLLEDGARVARLRELSALAGRWVRTNRDEDALLSGPELIEATALQKAHPDEVPPPVVTLIAASRRAAINRRWRRRAVWIGAVLLLLAGTVVWAIVDVLRDESAGAYERHRDLALYGAALDYGGLASQPKNPARAAAYLREVEDVDRHPDWLSAAFSLLRRPMALARFGGGLDGLHQREIRRVRVDRDGRWIALLRDGGEVGVHAFDGRGDGVRLTGGLVDGGFADDGHLLTRGADGHLRRWKLSPRDGDVQVELVEDVADPPPMIFDGPPLLDAQRTQQSEPLNRLRGHGAELVSIATSADGHRLATLDKGGVALTWDLGEGREPRVVPREGGPWLDAVFDPDGARIAVASEDGWLCVRTVEPGPEPSCTRHVGAHATALDWSPDGRLLLEIRSDGGVGFSRASAPPAGIETRVREGARATAARFLPKHPGCALVGWSDGRPSVECVASPTSPALPEIAGGAVTAVATSGEFAATAHEDQTVHIWKLDDPRDHRRVPLPHYAAAIAFDAFGGLDVVFADGSGLHWSSARPEVTKQGDDGSSSWSAAREESVEPRRGGLRGVGRFLGVEAGAGGDRVEVSDIGTYFVLLGSPRLALGDDISRARVDRAGRQVASVHRDGGVRVWQVGAEGVRRRLWESTSVCLADLDWQIADPGQAVPAADRVAACERRFGRTPAAMRSEGRCAR